MNQDTLEGSWDQLKGKVKKQWGRLSDDDINTISGNKDELVGKLKSAYGYDKERASKEIEKFLSNSNVGEVFEKIGNKITNASQEVKENVEQYSSELKDYINKSPVKAAVIAGSVGLLAGFLLRVWK